MNTDSVNDHGPRGERRIIRVLAADDHPHVREVVERILATADDVDLIASVGDGQQAVAACQDFQPDILLIDVVMPVMDGVQATRLIRARDPDLRILVLSSYHDHESVHAMLRSGANGYVLKGSLASDLLSAIRATYHNKSVFSSEIAARLVQPAQPTSLEYTLTERELEVLGLMAGGQNNRQIANGLDISESTVKFHITNILEKLGVETRAEGLVAAAKHNLI